MSLDAYQVDKQDAVAQSTAGETAAEQDNAGTALSPSAVLQSRARGQPVFGETITDAAPQVAAIAPSRPTGQIVSAARPPEPVIPAASPVATALASSPPPAAPIQAAALPAPSTKAATQPLPAVAVDAAQALASAVAGLPLPAIAAETPPPEAQAIVGVPPPSEATTATLAWNFGERIVTDPASLAVIQAFMAPVDLASSNTNAGDVRDGLAAILTGVDCARLTATFVPETGELELRGHVPDPAMQAPILKALREQIGDGIPVTGNLLHLPHPQCGALSGIAEAGLPQSTDQLTNALLIGNNAQAREYGFTEGQRLAFDLTAPDYDAVVYVDYFDAGGQVIHLIPNETVPLTRHPAKSGFGVGTDSAGGPSLNITIGPPFGQEIAVAFAASTPLFEDLRPLIEPAETYLAELKQRVAEARAADPGFKGEWVYFFITTSPATQ